MSKSNSSISIQNFNPRYNFIVFPNPIIKSFRIESIQTRIVNLVIYNISGQSVYENKEFKTNHELNLEYLSAGLYYLKINDKGFMSTYKITRL